MSPHSDIFLFIHFGTEFVGQESTKQFCCTTLIIQKFMGKINIKPLADRVVIEPAQAEQKTASGIIIPDTAKEKPQKGTVVAVGPGTKDAPLTLKEGDVVIYGKYAGTEYVMDGVTYLIMRESDIIAVI